MPFVCGIYVIRRVGSGECYVGQSINIRKRFSVHRADLARGRHSSRFMQRVYNKHGLDVLNFEILESGLDPADKERLRLAEQKWIDLLQPAYNWLPASGSRAGLIFSDEEKAKRSRRMIGNKFRVGKAPDMKGKHHTDETRRKISAKAKGRAGPNPGIPRTDEVKRKISAAKVGRPSPKKGIPSGKKGASWTEARREAFLMAKGLITGGFSP